MKKYTILIVISFILEFCFLSFFRNSFGPYISPVVLFICSLAIGILPLVFYQKLQIKQESKAPEEKTKIFEPIIIYSVAAIFTFLYFRKIIQSYPIDPSVSDIIPTVQILSQRFIDGVFPYTLITDFGYHLPPTYLPLQWLPFIFSSFYSFDPRYMVIGAWLFAIALYSLCIHFSKAKRWHKALLILLPFLILNLFMADNPGVFGRSIELLPAAYYILLILTLFSSSLIFRSLGIIFPLLSRYSFVLWLPVYFLMMFIKEARWKSVLSGVYVLLLVTSLYFIPFFMRDGNIFKNGYNYYTEAALGEWQVQEWQDDHDKPWHLFSGVGFASFYYDYVKGDTIDKLNALKKTHVILSALAALALAVLFFRLKNTVPERLFLLAGLKIYLTIFYSFIQVPYVYLQLVPVFISILIVASLFIESKKSLLSIPSLKEVQ
jgi:hypothetical protein